jgi:hypothetical protein
LFKLPSLPENQLIKQNGNSAQDMALYEVREIIDPSCSNVGKHILFHAKISTTNANI